jgi:hypothetical protein
MGHGSRRATEQVKQNEPQPARIVFDIISKYPEVEHIAGNMRNTSVQKH